MMYFCLYLFKNTIIIRMRRETALTTRQEVNLMNLNSTVSDWDNYHFVTVNGNWLEDSHKGRFSRYETFPSESVWLDHDNETIINDPDETLQLESDDDDFFLDLTNP